jgi:hypothetical protein
MLYRCTAETSFSENAIEILLHASCWFLAYKYCSLEHGGDISSEM